jgi:hypothetical protein
MSNEVRKSLTAPTHLTLAAFAALGMAACSDPVAPSTDRGPLLHTTGTGSYGAVGTVTVCKEGPAGTYNFTATKSDNRADAFQSSFSIVVPSGATSPTCVQIFDRTTPISGPGNVDTPTNVTITELAAPGTTLASIDFVSGAGPGSENEANRQVTVSVNEYHASGATFHNVAAPTTVCTFTQGFFKNKGDKSGLVAQLLMGTHTYIVGGQLNVGFTTIYSDGTLTAAQIDAILETPTRGSAELILLHQLITAELNVIRGASAPGIAALITEAQSLLAGGITSMERARAIEIAELLDQFNNGDYPGGPRHCGDENDD